MLEPSPRLSVERNEGPGPAPSLLQPHDPLTHQETFIKYLANNQLCFLTLGLRVTLQLGPPPTPFRWLTMAGAACLAPAPCPLHAGALVLHTQVPSLHWESCS